MAGRAELDRGRGLRAKCKSLSKTTWKHHERRQNNSVENAFQRFALSFVSFLRRKHDFRRRISTFVWRILFEEPRIWISGFNLRTRVLKPVRDHSSRTSWHAQWLSRCKNTSGWRLRYQERLVLKFPGYAFRPLVSFGGNRVNSTAPVFMCSSFILRPVI